MRTGLHYFFSMVFVFATFAFLLSANAKTSNPILSEDLLRIKDIGEPDGGPISVSPDGEWIVFQLHTPNVESGSFDISWISVPIKNPGAHMSVADGGELNLNPTKSPTTNGYRLASKAEWSPDSTQFAYRLKLADEVQIWMSRPGSVGRTKLTFGPRDVVDLKWSADGSKIFYRTGMDKPDIERQFDFEDTNGFLFDNRFFPIENEHRMLWGKTCESFGQSTQLTGIEYDCERRLWVFDLDAGAERLATETEEAEFEEQSGIASVDRSALQDIVGGPITDQNSDTIAWFKNENPALYRGLLPYIRLNARVGETQFECSSPVCLFRSTEALVVK